MVLEVGTSTVLPINTRIGGSRRNFTSLEEFHELLYKFHSSYFMKSLVELSIWENLRRGPSFYQLVIITRNVLCKNK